MDLESACPFWTEAGQCMNEGCSVCTCDENEIPKPWLEGSGTKPVKVKHDYGWITSSSSGYGYEGKGHDDSLGRISVGDADSDIENMFQYQTNLMNGNKASESTTTGAGTTSEEEGSSDGSGMKQEAGELHICGNELFLNLKQCQLM